MMSTKDSSRESHFPAIEKKYGEPMSYWLKVISKLEGKKYPEQISHLRENYGFSQTHANAVVMFSRGSTSSRKYATPTEYYKTLDPKQAKTVRAIFKSIKSKYPELELVIAWNQPVLRLNDKYIIGVSASKNHILFAPWSNEVIKKFTPRMKSLDVKKKTIGVPNDWEVDARLLQAIVKARIAEVNK